VGRRKTSTQSNHSSVSHTENATKAVGVTSSEGISNCLGFNAAAHPVDAANGIMFHEAGQDMGIASQLAVIF